MDLSNNSPGQPLDRALEGAFRLCPGSLGPRRSAPRQRGEPSGYRAGSDDADTVFRKQQAGGDLRSRGCKRSEEESQVKQVLTRFVHLGLSSPGDQAPVAVLGAVGPIACGSG